LSRAGRNGKIQELNESEVDAAEEMARTLIEHAESTRLIGIKGDVPGFVKHTSDALRSLDKGTKKTINSVFIKSFSAAKKAVKEKP
jgi:hypothetical protein